MTEAGSDELERRSLIRAVRQRLDSLARAGVDRVPLPPIDDTATAPVAAVGSESLAPAGVPTSSVASPGGRSSVRAGLPEGSDGASPSQNQERSGITPPSTAMRSLFDTVGFDTPAVPPEGRLPILQTLAAEVAGCRKCPHLAETRTQTVFGVGPATRALDVRR